MISDTPEPPPIRTDETPLWDLVINDINKMSRWHDYRPYIIEECRARDRFGRAKYGMPLTVMNGRNALNEITQELQDSIVYMKQAILEGMDVDGMLENCYYDVISIMETIFMIKLENEAEKEEE